MSSSKRRAAVWLALAHCLSQAAALSTGAPGAACASLRPLHALHRPKPASASQFFVTQSALGRAVGVEIATHSSERFFRGFLVQAYDPASGSPMGHFQASAEARPLAACSAATHRNAHNKRRVSLVWTADAPAHSAAHEPSLATWLASLADDGRLAKRQPDHTAATPITAPKQVRFRATIVVTYQEFYTGFESSELNFKRFDYFQGNHTSHTNATANNSTAN